MKIRVFLLYMVAILLLVCCSEKTEPESKPGPESKPETEPETVLVTADSITLPDKEYTILVGQTITIYVSVKPANAVESLKWSSSSECISLTSSGSDDTYQVKGLSEGEAVVTITSGDKSATCTIYVKGERTALIKLYEAAGGPNWKNNTNWCSDEPLDKWYGIDMYDGYVCSLWLNDNNLEGDATEIFDAISLLSHLERCYLCCNPITGQIPATIQQLQSLIELDLGSCRLSGSIPEEIGNLTNLLQLSLCDNPELTGPIPHSIGNLSKATWINLSSCNLTGNLPEEITMLDNLAVPFKCRNNPLLSGTVPDAFAKWKYWDSTWGEMISGTGLRFGKETTPHCPEFSVYLPDGSTITSEILKDNKLTILYQWATWCTGAQLFLPVIKNAYKQFHEKGLGIISWADPEESADWVSDYVETNEFVWPNFLAQNNANQIKPIYLFPRDDLAATYPCAQYPAITAFDSEGNLVYEDVTSDWADTFISFISEWFGEEWNGENVFYESTDYSLDGRVTVLQEARQGRGIDLVILGDGFSDRQIAAGKFLSAADIAMEGFFSREPYRSFRDYFNVIAVDAVSKNEGYQGPESVFSCEWLGLTTIHGDEAKVIEYVSKVIPEERMDNFTAIVLMNSNLDAGTCSLLLTDDTGDWGTGIGIAFYPAYNDSQSYLASHEAGGHGFAKLADEYIRDYGQIDEESIDNIRDLFNYGWYPNIDFTDNPKEVKWHAFLEDDRYTNEQLGVYEGAYYYTKGVFRPSLDGVMNSDHEAGYNAPSRYAIWYRIHKLAFGAEWSGTYEDFVEYDAVNRQQQNAIPTAGRYVRKSYPQLPPPVVHYRSWREMLSDESR